MEFWDLYDEHLHLIAKKYPSTGLIPPGTYHLSVEVWPFDGQRFFLTKRSWSKKYYPGYWECTGGHVLSGESFLQAAQREVKEELGISMEEDAFTHLATDVKKRHIVTVYLLELKEGEEFRLSAREIETGQWFSLQELESLHLDFEFVPHQFSRYVSHVRGVAFSAYSEGKPDSVQRMLRNHAELCVPKRGLPDVGHRPDLTPYTGMLGSIKGAFDIYGDQLYTKQTILPESVNNSLGGGSPLLSLPFPPAAQAIKDLLNKSSLSQYAFPAGDIGFRRSICRYLHHEGFCEKITPDNIIFTDSTTHAFHVTLQMIVRPGDVVLFTAPSYGLFCFEPERLGGVSCFFPLYEEDGWLTDPLKLAKEIDRLNEKLRAENPGPEHPRVVAFFQQNPHNPLGKVMGTQQKELVKQIASVCRKRGVFLIDDLLYRDLCFQERDLALPAAHFEEEYQNVISLLGLSKSYGLAGLRAGMIVADEVLIRGIRNRIFQTIDSASHLSAAALAASFDTGDAYLEAYHRYFFPLRKQYCFRLQLVVAAVRGLDAVESEWRQQITETVYRICGQEKGKKWLLPLSGVDFVRGTMPEAGFFCLLDFTALKGKTCDGVVIRDDLSLLDFLFSRYRLNFITGKSIGWPDPEQIVMRISFSYEPEKIVRVFGYLKEEIGRLDLG